MPLMWSIWRTSGFPIQSEIPQVAQTYGRVPFRINRLLIPPRFERLSASSSIVSKRILRARTFPFRRALCHEFAEKPKRFWHFRIEFPAVVKRLDFGPIEPLPGIRIGPPLCVDPEIAAVERLLPRRVRDPEELPATGEPVTRIDRRLYCCPVELLPPHHT